MLNHSQHVYHTTDLDPGLLSTPFRVQTNWHVLTGAACTGKTTLVEMLAGRGFQIVTESGRHYFERENKKGRIHRDKTLGPEDDTTSDFLNEWFARDYSTLGYHVVRVPVLPPEERLAFILDRLSGHGRI